MISNMIYQQLILENLGNYHQEYHTHLVKILQVEYGMSTERVYQK